MNIKQCRVCNSKNLEDVIDLGDQPWCNDFVEKEMLGKENLYPLVLCYCHDCTTLQVKYTVPKEIMYSDHTYLSGSNKGIIKHFENVARSVSKRVSLKNELVIDIGSNDGTLLKCFNPFDVEVLGIEPSKTTAEIARNNGINTLNSFFNNETANLVKKEYGKPKVISAANVFYHVEDLHSILSGIKDILSQDGIFVIQASYLPNLINLKEFDIMYHEHLLYYRVGNLKTLLDIYDLEIFDIEEANVHGGSFIAFVGHKNQFSINKIVYKMIENEELEKFNTVNKYKEFNNQIVHLKEELNALIHKLKQEGRTIAAYGAPAKGTVLLNYCGLNSTHLDFSVEVNDLKYFKFIPNTGIQILPEASVDEPDYYLLLSWNFFDVFSQSKEFKSGLRKFILPMPKPHIETNTN